MIHKVSIRASEFQSHSKQTEETLSSPEEDSVDIVQGVVSDIDEESKTGNVSDADADWGTW